MTQCAVCGYAIKIRKWEIVIRDYVDGRGDWQSHPIHGTCLDRLWAWAKTQRKSAHKKSDDK